MNINYKTKLLQCLMLLLFMSSHRMASAQNQPLDFFQVEQVHNSNIIQNAYSSFPKGTIHIIGIDSELSPENKPKEESP